MTLQLPSLFSSPSAHGETPCGLVEFERRVPIEFPLLLGVVGVTLFSAALSLWSLRGERDVSVKQASAAVEQLVRGGP